MEGVNNRIKQLRIGLNLTQEEFGSRIGLSKSGISNIENGTRPVSQRHIKLISKEFGVSEWWLGHGGDNQKIVSAEEKMCIYNAFHAFLKSLGYQIEDDADPNTITWHYEDEVDPNGTVIGRSKVIDDAEVITSIIKGGKPVSFSSDEYEHLHAEISDFIEYRIWKHAKANNENK